MIAGVAFGVVTFFVVASVVQVGTLMVAVFSVPEISEQINGGVVQVLGLVAGAYAGYRVGRKIIG